MLGISYQELATSAKLRSLAAKVDLSDFSCRRHQRRHVVICVHCETVQCSRGCGACDC